MAEKVMFPRSLAVRVLTRVLSDHELLDEALAASAAELSPTAMAWLQEITSGTLRWKGRLDWILDSISLKKKPSGWLRKILLLAAYQLIVQDRVHAGAVVSETVSEIKTREGEAPAKFANACLRKIAEHALQWRNWSYPLQSQSKDSKQAAAWASLPPWLWTKLVNQHGLEWAQAYALASLERPSLWIRSKNPQWQADGTRPGPIPSAWQVESGGSVVDRPGFQEGEFIVQDISSQFLIAQVVTSIQEQRVSPQITALDVCAAPGGKSIGLAWSGFCVIATDKTESRIPLLKQTVERVASSGVQVIAWNALEHCKAQDLIWVDAPCSGTGILRRHPDVRWLRQEKELASLTQAQRKLLQETWEKVPVGGFLVYSVCSVLKEEGPEAIEKSGLQDFLVHQWFLFPQSGIRGDGFWAALLRKK